MLAKLLKHDFAALSRILVPVHLAVLAVGAAALACFGFARMVDEGSAAGTLESLTVLGLTGGGICTLALGAAPIATFAVVVRRWYANLFTDEGYLTLTLPAKAGAHVASKTIAGFVWMVIDLAVLLALFIGVTAVLSGDLTAVYKGYFEGTLLDVLGSWRRLVLQTASGLAQLLAVVLLAYASFSLGAAVASRHRVAAGVGIFVGVSWAIGLVSGLVSAAGLYLAFRNPYASALSFPPPTVALVTSVAGIVFWLAAAAGLYALCVYLLKNKVDLP